MINEEYFSAVPQVSFAEPFAQLSFLELLQVENQERGEAQHKANSGDRPGDDPQPK